MGMINLLFEEDDIVFAREMDDSDRQVQFHRDLKLVSEFCKRERIGLRRVDVTYEHGVPENLYSFSDNLGGYTIEGIRGSLE
ncbi:MAG: hypothetical protein AABX11_01400 [Nanoarchaeota archaeon]